MTLLVIQFGGLELHFWTQQAILLTRNLIVRREFGQGIKSQSQDTNQGLFATRKVSSLRDGALYSLVPSPVSTAK
jgi:hypothetical protein